MYKLKLGILSLAIIIFSGTISQVSAGVAPAPSQLMVVLADRQALAETEGGTGIAKSFMGLISTLKEGHLLAFTSVDEPTDVLGPNLIGNPEFSSFLVHVDARLASSGFAPGADWVKAITETYNFLSSEQAPRGSTVYLIAGGTSQTDLADAADRLKPVVNLFKETEWSIIGLSLPGTSPEARGFLTGISEGSGGHSFELSPTEGFRSLSSEILREEAKGSLAQLGAGDLLPHQVLTITLPIAPGTRESTLLFFKEDPYGSLRLSNPFGLESSSGDRTLSSVTETPNVVIWSLIDPAPGQWRVDVRGIEGVVSAWHHADNKYSPALESIGPVAINDSASLIASVRDDQQRVVLEGVTVVARVTTPDGTTLVHELSDDGVSGDSVAADGYYSATILPLGVEGEYKVELELFWPEFGHSISSQATFRAQAFPVIELTPLQTEGLKQGERHTVASILVHVSGQPYAVSVDELTSGLTSNVDEAGVLEIKPTRLVDQGRAWMYDVFFTPEQPGLQTLVFYLNMEYAGKRYIHTSDHILLSSALPASPPVVVVPPASAAPPAAPQLPPIQPRVEPSSFPLGLIAVPIAVVVALVAGAIFWISRTYPYGFLYNDRDELVVDFGSLKRRPIMSLLFKNFVFGKELEVPGLEGVAFNFSRDRISLRSRRSTPTVRVNNQPLVSEAALQHRTWLGAHGRLYSFLLSPRGNQMEPGLADD